MNNGPAGEVGHRRGAILGAHSAAWASALGRNAAAGLRPERVRRDESRLYAGNFPLLRHLRLGQEKKNGFFLLFPLGLHYFGSAQLSLRLGQEKKNGFFLLFPLGLHYFGSAQLRLRLGQEKKNGFFLLLPLGLH